MSMRSPMAGVPPFAALEGADAEPLDGRDPDVVRALADAVRWRTFVGESPIGIIEVDLDDGCTFVNPAFERLTGLSTDEALGRGLMSVIASEDVARVRAQQRDSSACELCILRGEGRSSWVMMRWAPLRGQDGRETAPIERHAHPHGRALASPARARARPARTKRSHAVAVLARYSRSRRCPRPRGGVTCRHRARRAGRRRGTTRLRCRGVIARTTAPPAGADDDDRGTARCGRA